MCDPTACFAESGHNVTRVDLAHINNQFVYAGDGNYDGLLAFEDVTEQAKEHQGEVQALISRLRDMLSAGEPDINVGPQCTTPFNCGFIDHCTGPLAEVPVYWLPGGRRAAQQLVDAGYNDIRDIPEGYLRNKKAEWTRRVTVEGEPELDPAAAEELAGLGWPRYYFDFETLAPAVPRFAGTSPYKAEAFQWSCHIEHEDGRLEHAECLPPANQAPMRACAESLIEALGDSGPVFMYSAYERGVIKRLIEHFPDLELPLASILDRLFDLLPVTQRNYNHPDMHGSWSIKAVLPTVAPDLSYADLDIVSVGTQAGDAWLESIAPETPEPRKAELREALLRYCKLDTLAMVRLAWFLEGRER